MIDIATFRQLALSLPEATEQPHFEKPSFWVGKKIFATLDVKKNQACIKLSQLDQDVFSVFDKTIIFPVPNKWGKKGWTFVNLNTVREDTLVDALTTAYCEVAPKKLSVVLKSRFSL